jgi:hypothetical protein
MKRRAISIGVVARNESLGWGIYSNEMATSVLPLALLHLLTNSGSWI